MFPILLPPKLGTFKQGVSKQGVMTFDGDRDRNTMSPRREVPTLYWQAIVTHDLVVLQQGEDVAFV